MNCPNCCTYIPRLSRTNPYCRHCGRYVESLNVDVVDRDWLEHQASVIRQAKAAGRKRRCRECGKKNLSASRYFSCMSCVRPSDRPTEFVYFENFAGYHNIVGSEPFISPFLTFVQKHEAQVQENQAKKRSRANV